MHKKIIFSILVSFGLIFASLLSWAESNKFPELKPLFDLPKDYKLVFKDGPDFYLWYCGKKKNNDSIENAEMGMYFGLHPNFEKENKKNVIPMAKWRDMLWCGLSGKKP